METKEIYVLIAIFVGSVLVCMIPRYKKKNKDADKK